MNTLKHIPCIFFVVSYSTIYATGQQQPSEKCASAIAVIGSIVNMVDGHITNQWLQVDLQEPTTVTGLLTQGRSNCCNQWVRSFKVSYGNSESSLAMYQENGATKIFTGNHDETTIKENRFSQPITARYIRIHPVTWQDHISMRIEILDC
uniref:lactadherin-like n=1 Tax=Styela clava TaxID=7725 RepID=UPI00193A52EE|nr:lactadherin-like [Styela clava]